MIDRTSLDPRPLRILAVTPYPMVPTISGGRLRSFHLVSALLERGHALTNWVVTDDDAPLTWTNDQVTPSLRQIPALARIGFARKVQGLLSRYPEGPWSCPPPESTESDATSFDVAILFQAHVGRFAVPLTRAGIPVIYCAENVESELVRRLAPLALTRMSGARFRLDARKFEWFEANLIRQVSLVMTVSERDAAQLHELAPSARIEVLPSGADVRGISFVDHTENRADVLIFVGTLGYLPNRDGITWFIERILPLVRAVRPQVRVRLVGSSPPSAFDALDGEGVELIGLVEEVQSQLGSADLFVAPLRAGAGTRLKLLEAFAAGIPVVATGLAAEGIQVIDRTHLMIANDERSFAASILELLEDPMMRQRMSVAARRLVDSRYDWATIGARFERLVRDLVASRSRRHAP